jgi:hypothetical protein
VKGEHEVNRRSEEVSRKQVVLKAARSQFSLSWCCLAPAALEIQTAYSTNLILPFHSSFCVVPSTQSITDFVVAPPNNVRRRASQAVSLRSNGARTTKGFAL